MISHWREGPRAHPRPRFSDSPEPASLNHAKPRWQRFPIWWSPLRVLNKSLLTVWRHVHPHLLTSGILPPGGSITKGCSVFCVLKASLLVPLALQSFSQPALQLLNLITPSMKKTWVRSSASEHQTSCQPVPGLLHVSLSWVPNTHTRTHKHKATVKSFSLSQTKQTLCSPKQTLRAHEHMTSVPTEVIEKAVLQKKD